MISCSRIELNLYVKIHKKYRGERECILVHNFGPNQELVDRSTVNMIFNVTCYLGLCSAISVYCISHILLKNVKLVVWTLYNINNFIW